MARSASSQPGIKGKKAKPGRTPAIRLGDQQPIYQQIATHIQSQINTGKLSPGDRVPSVRQLATELAIAPATVARSLRMLVESGVLEARVGSGTRVAMRRPILKTLGILGNTPFQVLSRGPYYKQMLMMLQSAIVSRGWTVVYAHCPADQPLAAMFADLKAVDGLFLLGDHQRPAEQWRALRETGKPVMIMGGTANHAGLLAAHSDHFNDCRRATLALVRRGHRRIAFLAHDLPFYKEGSQARYEGHAAALRETGLPVDPSLRIETDIPGMIQRLKAIAPPAALMANGIAHIQEVHDGLLGSQAELGSKLLICAYDEHLRQNMGGLGITYWRIEQPIEELAERAAAGMMRKAEHPDTSLSDIILPSRVVEITAQMGMHIVPESLDPAV